ncbi:lipoate--protein ligase family protein [Paenibacillus athensensis]|uniref:BPL/LPL catalytic domain-containing protein n=1 Tax=Paenibacillus athensensis TaxID=1967502 RepID=A0A4Y8Q0N2_9BACL|nr:lipoate--protein ligase family protein [Paenibacillus athensensis]MCD1258287.1 lipoate--protein ligase family protein [Paenibacillus athensensis]
MDHRAEENAAEHKGLWPGLVVFNRMDVGEEDDVLYPFALDELLCRRIGLGAPPMLHVWRHPRAFVMGLRDSRLPKAREAARELEEQGWRTAVRNSGGAAVPLDLDVINLSLLLPKSAGDMEHRKDFEQMVTLLRETLRALTDRVDQGEVAGSFCPGEFDLSIGGRKFCGIAQRRQQLALSVQAFVIVNGSGRERGERARAFYERAAVGASANSYPLVEPARMASLAECLGAELTPHRFAAALLERLAGSASGEAQAAALAAVPDEAEIRAMAEQLRSRYGFKE